jgi:endonuclease/exonuclease/phosphatase family metal-dependent hydrolase
VTLHIWFGDHPRERRPELQATADWLARRARQADEFNRNMIALGDFNIDRLDDPNWRAFVVEYGLSPPDKLLDVPRTVGETRDRHSFYDQIAWFNDGRRAKLTLGYRDAGGFEWTRYLLERTRQTEKEARISDHYPLWAEFSLTD